MVKSFVAASVAGCLIVSIGFSPVHAGEIRNLSVTQNLYNLATANVESAKAQDLEGLVRKVNKLRSSDALRNIFKNMPESDEDKVLELLAAGSTESQVDRFVEISAGKVFEVRSLHGTDSVELVEYNKTGKRSKREAPRCAAAWAAVIGYFAATEMICVPVGVLGGIPAGIICNGIFYGAGMLPDFNAKCKK